MMSKLISASEAARRLGVTDKTVRSWIKAEKLGAIHIQKNLLGIPEQDVERLRKERSLYVSTQQPDTTELTARLEHVEQELTDISEQYRMLEQRIAAKHDTELSIASLDMELLKLRERLEQLERAEKDVSPRTPDESPMTLKERRPHATTPVAAKGTLPEGLVAFTDFFKRHGISESTARRGMEAKAFPIVSNEWHRGNAVIKQALDAEGQIHFCQFFSTHKAFHQCDLADCPCHTIAPQQ